VKKLVCLLSFLIGGLAQAAGTVDFLKIDKDIVLFSTTETKASSPTCVATENADNWAVSLKSESGRAIYSLIVTAMAKELALDVDSAGDCADAEGLERASGVNLAVASTEPNASVPTQQVVKIVGHALIATNNNCYRVTSAADGAGVNYILRSGSNNKYCSCQNSIESRERRQVGKYSFEYTLKCHILVNEKLY